MLFYFISIFPVETMGPATVDGTFFLARFLFMSFISVVTSFLFFLGINRAWHIGNFWLHLDWGIIPKGNERPRGFGDCRDDVVYTWQVGLAEKIREGGKEIRKEERNALLNHATQHYQSTSRYWYTIILLHFRQPECGSNVPNNRTS